MTLSTGPKAGVYRSFNSNSNPGTPIEICRLQLGLKEGQSTGLSIQCVVVSCLRAPWGAPHPAWRTAKGLLRPPYVFPRRSHRDGAAETAREGWVTTLSRWSFPEPLCEPSGEPQLKN